MPWGKHKGRPLTEIPEQYLRWGADQRWIEPSLRAEIEAVVGIGQAEEGQGPAAVVGSVGLAGITFRWWAGKEDEFGDGPGQMEVVGVGLNKLKELCTAFTGKSWPEG